MTIMVTKPKNVGGRPTLPAHIPVVDSASCCIAMSREVMRPLGGRNRQMAALAKLHRMFIVGERLAVEQRRVAALEAMAKAEAELADTKRREHLRRFAMMPIGAVSLLKQVASLQAKLRTLEQTPLGNLTGEAGHDVQ